MLVQIHIKIVVLLLARNGCEKKIKIKDEKYMGFAYKFLLLLNSTLASSTTNYVPFFENKRSSEKWQGSKKGVQVGRKSQL